MTNISTRFIYFMSFMLVLFLLGFSFYLEKYQGFNPCPLCLLQRFMLILLGVIFLFGSILRVKKITRIIIALLASMTALAGLFLSARQVWLQTLPKENMADCGVSLRYMLEMLPFDQVMQKVLQGSAECAQTGWEFIGISLAGWSLCFFLLFFVISIFCYRK